MAWLDALRAVAALLVVYAHLSHYLLRGAREFSAEWLHAGTAGVMLFFLVSGYIIPASLERHGDLRAFWINRMARLLPLYVVVAVLCVAVLPLDPYLTAHPATAVAAHATMLTHLLGVPLVTPVFWTLTFEMAFYLVVSALFALGRHRASAGLAVGLAVAAVLAAPLSPGGFVAPAVAVGVLTAGLAALTSGRRPFVVTGAFLLLAGAAALLLAGQDESHVWDGLLIPAVMFVGTSVYRAEHGQVPRRHAVVAAAVVAAALLTNWFAELVALDALTPRYMTRSLITLLVIGGTFALGMTLRHRRAPRAAAWIGLVSYSVYLVHVPLIQLTDPVLAGLGERLRGPVELIAVAAFLAVLLGLSGLCHRFVEQPGQRLGRRLASRLADRRSRVAVGGPPEAVAAGRRNELAFARAAGKPEA
jgi:peptidoglycan/LPS O-acetylase OafA/YrhL